MRLSRLLLGLIVFMAFVVIGLPMILVRPGGGSGAPTEGSLLWDLGADLQVKVYVNGRNELIELPLEEYVKEVVAAEMPALFHPEALKAQAVASRTYVVVRMRIFGGAGCDRHPAADVCADPAEGQAWSPRDELKKKWGVLGYSVHWPKIEQAVEDTRGLIIVYQGAPIDALFHAASGGRTEDAENVWFQAVPYLRGVDSPWEKGIKYDNVSITIPLSQVAERLGVPPEQITATTGEGRSPVTVLDRTASGRVVSLRVGAKTFSGREFRQALNLNSTLLTLQREGDKLIVTTSGYGHGVGMSQYGADALAKAGRTYRDIIGYYYTAVTLRPIFAE